MLSKVSQAQKSQRLHVFPYMWKLNLYIHNHICIYIHIYSERENKILLVSLKGLWEAGEGKKMLSNENY
jgi:hypothetical protein